MVRSPPSGWGCSCSGRLICAGCRTKYIRIRHSDYWLAPERRSESVARLALWFNWFAVATVALIVLSMELTVLAGITHTTINMTALYAGLGLYAASWVFSLRGSIRAFAKVPSTD